MNVLSRVLHAVLVALTDEAFSSEKILVAISNNLGRWYHFGVCTKAMLCSPQSALLLQGFIQIVLSTWGQTEIWSYIYEGCS